MQVRAALAALPGVLIRLRWLRNAGSSYSEAFQSSYSSASISPFSSCARFSAHSSIAIAALGECGALGFRERPEPSAEGTMPKESSNRTSSDARSPAVSTP